MMCLNITASIRAWLTTPLDYLHATTCRHHKTSELRYNEHSMQGSDEPVVDAGSRMIVVSWMVEVAEEFGLQQETLHLAVVLLDRFLRASNV